MMQIDPKLIDEARARIAPYIRRTPLVPFDYLSERTGKNILLKCETLQRTGSYKIRGAANCILSQIDQAKKRGIIAASAGNHAQGVAAMAKLLGISATIVMPETTPALKVQNTLRFGAKVELYGKIMADAFLRSKKLAEENGYLYIHPFFDPLVIAGQGTVGLELAEAPEFKDVQAVVVPVGGGGLSTGIALALRRARPDVKIYGVTARHSPSTWKSFHLGEVTEEPTLHTLAEGIAVKPADTGMIKLMKSLFTDCMALSEESIALAISVLAEHGKLVAEGAAASTVAAVVEDLIPEKNICLLISGGNVDIPTLSHVLHWGLAEQGRLMDVSFTIPDRPGALNSLTRILGESGANILQVFHQRSSTRHQFGEVVVEVSFETKGREHTEQILAAIRKSGVQVRDEGSR